MQTEKKLTSFHEPARELLQSLAETQTTIRAYDTKAEVLAIILTLVVGVLNFTIISEGCNNHGWIKAFSVAAIAVALSTLYAAGMVLFPRKNLFQDINVGEIKPKGTYFVDLESSPEYKHLDEYMRQVASTDWETEIGYELLKCTCIRENKHFWFQISLICAGVALLVISILLMGVAYYG